MKYPEVCCYRCRYFTKLSREMGLCEHINGQENTNSPSSVINKSKGTDCKGFEEPLKKGSF